MPCSFEEVKPGYANFAIADPPVKLVLFEGPEGATLNHLGVEVESAEEVVSAERRLTAAGLETTGVDETVCCFAEWRPRPGWSSTCSPACPCASGCCLSQKASALQ